MRDILDIQLPQMPEKVPTTKKQAITYWIDNLTEIRKYAEKNVKKARC